MSNIHKQINDNFVKTDKSRQQSIGKIQSLNTVPMQAQTVAVKNPNYASVVILDDNQKFPSEQSEKRYFPTSVASFQQSHVIEEQDSENVAGSHTTSEQGEPQEMTIVSADSDKVRHETPNKDEYVMSRMQWIEFLEVIFNQLETLCLHNQRCVEKENFL